MKIGWILLGNEEVASSRVEGIGIHNWMVGHGVDSHILYKPEGYNRPIPKVPEIDDAIRGDFTHLIFQKTCFGNALTYMKMACLFRKHVIYVLDDFYVEALPLLQFAQKILVGSTFLQKWVKDNTGYTSHVVNDYYEFDSGIFKTDYTPNNPPLALSFSGPGHVDKAVEVSHLITSSGYQYEIFSKHPKATTQWHNDYWKELLKADLIVIPHLGKLDDWEKAKGCNRPVTAGVLGLPVLTSPYPEYSSVIEQGKTGIICYNNDVDEWQENLKYLLDPMVREKMGKAARDSGLAEKFHINTIGSWWVKTLGE